MQTRAGWLQPLSWSSPGDSEPGVTIELAAGVHRPGLFRYRQPPTIQKVIEDGGGLILNQGLSLPRQPQLLSHDASLSLESVKEGGLSPQPGPLSLKARWILGRPIPLNRATIEDLQRIPGVGPGLALRIVEIREARGGFSDLRELTEVKGIKEKTYNKIKGFLTL